MGKGKVQLITSRQTDEGTVYDFRCPYPTGCGEDGPDGHTPFNSTGWMHRDHAAARGKQHVAEHLDGVPMQDLDSFRSDWGLTEASAGAAVKPDDWEF